MTLTLAEANRIIEGAIAQAQELKVEISVTVCDGNGRLIGLNRMDGAFAESNPGSIGKAIASAASGRPSGEAEASVDFSLRTGTVIGKELRSFDAEEACRLSAWVRLTALVVSAGPIRTTRMKAALGRAWRRSA